MLIYSKSMIHLPECTYIPSRPFVYLNIPVLPAKFCSTVCVIIIFHDLNEYNSTNMPDIHKIPFD